MSLANRPAKLIFKLYEHGSVQQRSLHGSKLDHLQGILNMLQENFFPLCFTINYHRTEVSTSNTLLADIHKIADEIGKINQVDLAKIRLKLLEQWLPSSLQNKQDDADAVRIFPQK